jgi:beta-glucosidase
VSQLPRPVLDGYWEYEANFSGDAPTPDAKIVANYDIEGSDVGYRWFARQGQKALFPFGYGLSYTSFAADGLKVDGLKASFTVKNTGKRAGAYGPALPHQPHGRGQTASGRLCPRGPGAGEASRSA